MATWAVSDNDQLNPVFFSFKDISCVLKVDGKPKILLDAVSGFCKALAIMGPSGAGKSTLLDVLAFRKTIGKWTQDVRLNGAQLQKRTFMKSSGYVTSDDLLPPELTVREMLRFGANLRLPGGWSYAQHEARIDDALEVMRLKHCENRRIGSAIVRGLSTGERKRCYIALELLQGPPVLFLDEPTTGLDSTTGREIVSNIVEVARLRKLACVATIHQPSYTILEQFDHLLLLAKGKLCYFGTVADAVQYFEGLGIQVTGNPAETYSMALAAQSDKLIQAWQDSALVAKVDAIHAGQGSVAELAGRGDAQPGFWERAGFYQVAGFHVQLWELVKRQVVIYFRNPVMSASRLIAGIVVALFFGVAYYQLQRNLGGYEGRAALAFLYKLMTAGLGSAAIAYWVEKRKLYYHEEAAGYYHRLAHLTAMFLVEWLFISLIMAIVGGIVFSMAGFLHPGRYVGYMIPEAFATTAVNMLCAYVAASIPYANATFTLQFYYSLILGGMYVSDAFLFARHPTTRTFWQWLSWARMMFVPMMRDEFVGQPLSCATNSERFPFEVTSISVSGLGGAAKNLTALAAAGNASLVAALNSFGIWRDAGLAVNDTLFGLYRDARRLANLRTARAAAASAGNPNSTLSSLYGLIADASSAFSSAVGIPTSSVTAFDESLNRTVRASALMGLANHLIANPLPITYVCSLSSGEEFVAGVLQFEWVIRNASNAVVGFGIDHPAVTPTSFYVGVAFVQGVGWFALAYLALRFCNFRQK
ncbi:hypothetical protein DFJ74DRAFT_772890 [Hyaloraphidium curvatum]|nr:hypothetical protein DFJ74DRAFT_772890 [Hyaloraphidium curvatum]